MKGAEGTVKDFQVRYLLASRPASPAFNAGLVWSTNSALRPKSWMAAGSARCKLTASSCENVVRSDDHDVRMDLHPVTAR